MALDPNILLRGIVPDAVGAASRGFQLGQAIRQGPARSRLVEQQAEAGELSLGQRGAVAMNQVFGNSSAEQITEQQFSTGISALESLGVPLSESEKAFNPNNIARAVQLSQAGQQISQGRRGAGQTGFQTNAPIITEQDGQKFFTSLQTDRATGKQQVSSIPISGAITDRLGLSAGDRVNQKQQEAIATATGKAIGGAEVSEIAAETAAETVAAEETAKAVVAADTAQKAAETAATIELEKGLAKDKAKRIASDMEKGAVAADSLGTVNRALDLLDIVETGGFENLGLRAQQAFGIESADEAELNNLLKTAVLQQLKPTFGAAFTQAEGDRLEKISQDFGSNTKTNIRLLTQMKQINERAAKRGIDAATAAKDFGRAKQIQDAIDFRFTFEDEQAPAAAPAQPAAAAPTPAAQAVQQPTGVQSLSDEDLFR